MRRAGYLVWLIASNSLEATTTHPENPTSTNHCQAYLHMDWHPRVAHAHPLPPLFSATLYDDP